MIGPYQGSLACLRIPFSRGVCGAAARERRPQLVPDVHAFPGHIACASRYVPIIHLFVQNKHQIEAVLLLPCSTLSEVVVPLASSTGRLLGVLDLDSDLPAAFCDADGAGLEGLCRWMGATWGGR